MKVLFLSHYKNEDKAGLYASNLLLAMHKIGIEIVFRHIENKKSSNNKIHPILLPIENGTLDGCTHCIQFLDSEYLLGTKKFLKNIAIVMNPSNSIHELAVFDEVWVFTDEDKNTVQNSLDNTTVRVINPVIFDVTDKLEYLYQNQRDIQLEDLSLSSVGKNIKEILGA